MVAYGEKPGGWAYNCLLHNWSGNVPCPDCNPVEQAMTAQEPCPVQAQMEGRPLPLHDGVEPRGRRIPTKPLDPYAPKANDRQVGGAHYAQEYQHWDFCVDADVPYLIGCASKYLTRWREKNGVQDLEKSLHYLQKAEEVDLSPAQPISAYRAVIQRFAAQLPPVESRAVVMMCRGGYDQAAAMIRDLITATASSATE